MSTKNAGSIFKGKYGKLFLSSLEALVIVVVAVLIGCSRNGRGFFASRDKAAAQNAQVAEAEEEKMDSEAAPEGAAEVAKKDEGHAEKKPAAHRKVASVAGGVYVVQLGAFKVKENAERLQAKLAQAGFKVEMHSMEHSTNGMLHLVRSSPMANRAEAESLAQEFKSKESLHAQIVRQPASN